MESEQEIQQKEAAKRFGESVDEIRADAQRRGVADMVQIMEFGKIRTDVLCEADTPPYMSIPLSEIDAIIMEYRLGR